ncbi:MAG: DMT family transporter, partial [Pseudomonadota bacterium]
MTQRTAPGMTDYGLLAILAVLWGLAFPLSKIAVEGYPPVTLTFARQIVAVAVLVLFVLLLRRQWRRPDAPELVAIAACSVFGSVLPFTLINWGVEEIDSGLAAILMGFMPLLTIVLAHMFTADDKLSVPKVIGVLLGLLGLCILFWPALVIGGDTLWRQIALIGAAACYAINALVIRSLTHWPPLILLTYIGFGTLALLFPLSFILEQ